jgi:hypothetical protein
MRLGQLSRKINTKTSDIVDYLKSAHQLDLSNHPNSKVPDEYMLFIEKHFQTNDLTTSALVEINQGNTSTSAQENEESVVDATSNIEESNRNVSPIELLKDEATAHGELFDTSENEVDLNIVDGVIKAPKLEVPGIKIVGKIDLPEPKIEVTDEAIEADVETPDSSVSIQDTTNMEINETIIPSTPSNEKTKSRSRNRKPKSSQKPAVPKLTPEEERRIKLKEAQKQQQEQRKNTKALRRERYLQETKAKQKQATAKKLKKQRLEKEARQNNQSKVKPTSLWGKFIYWLND